MTMGRDNGRGSKAFYAGAQALSVTLNIALQVVAILQVSSATGNAASPSSTLRLNEAFLIVFLSSLVLSLDGAIELASVSRPLVSAAQHRNVAWMQRHLPGFIYSAVVLSFFLLIANGGGLINSATYPFVSFLSLVCLLMEIPYVVLVYYDFARSVSLARQSYVDSWQYAPPANPDIHNTIDPMLQYLDSKRKSR